MFELLKSGFDSPCFDGQNFFDTDHPLEGADGATVTVSNMQAGAGPGWCPWDVSRGVRPIIWQEREGHEFTAVNQRDDARVFTTCSRMTPICMASGVPGDCRVGPVATGLRVQGGAGPTTCAVGRAVGRAESTVDNSGGAAGAATVEYRQGVFAFENASGDAVVQAGVGKLCFIVDDQTVAATNGTGTRSPAGIVEGIEGGRVWVRLDEAITRGA